jgi:hypothetical protein
MTFALCWTRLEGFEHQYGSEVTATLNKVYDAKGLDNHSLEQIGKAVSKDCAHELHGRTKDGYGWFGSLRFNVNGANVKVMFPWAQDFGNPESQLDRSIGVYSDVNVPEDDVKDLLENIACQMTLFAGSSRVRTRMQTAF